MYTAVCMSGGEHVSTIASRRFQKRIRHTTRAADRSATHKRTAGEAARTRAFGSASAGGSQSCACVCIQNSATEAGVLGGPAANISVGTIWSGPHFRVWCHSSWDPTATRERVETQIHVGSNEDHRAQQLLGVGNVKLLLGREHAEMRCESDVPRKHVFRVQGPSFPRQFFRQVSR